MSDDLIQYDLYDCRMTPEQRRYHEMCEVTGRTHEAGVTHLAFYRRGVVLDGQIHPN